MVAVRINDNKFKFFIEPLVMSSSVKPIDIASPLQNPFDYSELIDYNFAPNEYSTEPRLFGIKHQELVRVAFKLDEATMEMQEVVTEIPMAAFTGTQLQV